MANCDDDDDVDWVESFRNEEDRSPGRSVVRPESHKRHLRDTRLVNFIGKYLQLIVSWVGTSDFVFETEVLFGL